MIWGNKFSYLFTIFLKTWNTIFPMENLTKFLFIFLVLSHFSSCQSEQLKTRVLIDLSHSACLIFSVLIEYLLITINGQWLLLFLVSSCALESALINSTAAYYTESIFACLFMYLFHLWINFYLNKNILVLHKSKRFKRTKKNSEN